MKVKAKIKTSPCPFCSGEVNITHGLIGAPFWFFKCKECGATISFDNDEAGLASMIKLMKSDNDFKYFRWFNQNTKEKDVNDYVIAKNNVNIFSKADVLERMIVDKLLMKMYLLRNGLWK